MYGCTILNVHGQIDYNTYMAVILLNRWVCFNTLPALVNVLGDLEELNTRSCSNPGPEARIRH